MGPKFVAGLQQLGFTLFLWGIVATTLPIIVSLYVGKYLFRFDDAIVLGVYQAHVLRPRLSAWSTTAPKAKFRAGLYGHIRRRKYAFDNLGNGPRHAARLAAAIQRGAQLRRASHQHSMKPIDVTLTGGSYGRHDDAAEI